MTLPVDKKTYTESDDKTCRALTYDLFSAIHKNIEGMKQAHYEHIDKCNNRFKNIENNKRMDTVKASISGFFGGFTATMANYLRIWIR